MIEDKNEIKQESKTSEQTSENNDDTSLRKHKKEILDSETMILETQKRVWGALKKRL